MPDTNRYGPTAARKQGKPGREARPKSTTIDIHSHVAVPAAGAIANPHVNLRDVPLAHFATDNVKALNAKQEADRRTRISGIENGLDERLRDMDDMGLDMQLVMPPPPQCYYSVPVGDRREGDAGAQRRHRGLRRAQAGSLRRARRRAAAGRQGGRRRSSSAR